MGRHSRCPNRYVYEKKGASRVLASPRKLGNPTGVQNLRALGSISHWQCSSTMGHTHRCPPPPTPTLRAPATCCPALPASIQGLENVFLRQGHLWAANKAQQWNYSSALKKNTHIIFIIKNNITMLQKKWKIEETKETKISHNSFTLTQALLAFLVGLLSPQLWVLPRGNRSPPATVYPMFCGLILHPKHFCYPTQSSQQSFWWLPSTPWSGPIIPLAILLMSISLSLAMMQWTSLYLLFSSLVFGIISLRWVFFSFLCISFF